jgi:hypothetical protein
MARMSSRLADDLAELERAGHAHGDVVLFAAGGGDGIGAGGVSEHLCTR